VKEKDAANKTHFLQPMLPLKVRNCVVTPEHLRSEISTRALATFQSTGKERKQGEGIRIKCVVCSYFHKILHLYSQNL